MARDEVGSERSRDSASARASMEEVLRALTDPGARLEPTVAEVESPLGTLRLGAAEGWLCLAESIVPDSHWGTVCDGIQLRLGWRFGSGYHEGRGDRAVLDAAARQLEEYFAGSRTEFELPVWAPGRRLEQQVWQELLRIPRGQLRTFAQIATAIGRPLAFSSVAQAVGQNRLLIIIPCHRAVAASGRLTNLGMGQWAKRRLLELERVGTPLA